MNAIDRLIFALDVPNVEKAILFLDQLEGKVGLVKVNSLAAVDPSIVSVIQERKIGVWRDWKHKDIPGTVKNFIIADVEAGIEMTTIHIDGGPNMMDFAVEGAQGSNLKILGITVLTSINQETFNQQIGIPEKIEETVMHYAFQAERAGLNGVVASAKEAKMLREKLAKNTLIVTPGIKPIWAVGRADQARITTPYQAIHDGADYIVVGTAIRAHENPGEAADKIVAEIDQGLADRNF